MLQGLDHGPYAGQVREAMLAIPRIGDPLELKTFLEAADIYKEGRRRGYTIRSSTDCLIAALVLATAQQCGTRTAILRTSPATRRSELPPFSCGLRAAPWRSFGTEFQTATL